MKSGKDVGRENENPMDPFFPRLHINDTDKGGPRAPPRNKMALYEQLSVPSRRFGSSRPSASILLRSDAGFSPSGSSSQVVDHDRSTYTSPSIQRTPAFSTDKMHSSSNGLNTNVASSSRKSKLAKNIISKASNMISRLPEERTFHPHLVSKAANFGGWKPRSKDDCAALCADKGIASHLDEERVTLQAHVLSGHCTSNMPGTSKMHVIGGCHSRHKIVEGKLTKESNVADQKSRHSCVPAVGHGKCLAEGRTNGMGQVVGPMKKIRSSPNTERIVSQHLRHMKSIPNQIFLKGFSNDVSNVCKFRTFICPECTAGLGSDKNRNSGEVFTRDRWNIDADVMDREVFLRTGRKLSSRELTKKINEDLIKSKSNRNVLLDDRKRAAGVSVTSMMDSNSSLEVSPDAMVGLIGAKQFWKARRAMSNQQRIFSVQVFELHRLIKVQKFLAGSLDSLLDEDLMTPLEKIADGKLIPDYKESVPLEPTTKHEDGLPISSKTVNCIPDNPEKPGSSVSDIMNRGSGGQEPSHVRSDGSLSSHGHITTDNRNTTWCFPPLGSQWLVPVMSPSEGLVYMPVSSLNLPVVGGDTAKPAYGSLSSHHEGGVAILSSAPSYFPQGLHVVNPLISNPNAGEQASARSVSQVSFQDESSAADVNKNMHSQGSCNVSIQKVDAFSRRVFTDQASKDSNFHGSTCSNHCGRVQEAAGHASKGRDLLHLFPLTSATEEKSNQEHEQSNEHHQSQIIKVVPHNARSASRSAARIFQAIQKER